jgi:ferredoxin
MRDGAAVSRTRSDQERREPKVKVRVDPERCQGHTLCAMIAPAVFTLDDVDGHASAPGGEVPADQEAKAAEAIRSCPEQAISIIP